jgi:CheY-like chemotaxis protein
VVLDAAARMALGTDALQALAAELAHEVSAWAPLFELAVPAPSAIDIQEYEHPGLVASGRDRAASIVLVDGSEDDRLIACRILGRAGHRVHVVPNGEEALRAITSVLPHIVITDREMPGMDGTGLCRALRATRMGQDLYLILYTGRCRGRDLVAGIDAGADDFIS